MINIEEIINYSREILKESDDGAYSNTELAHWLNIAVEWVYPRLTDVSEFRGLQKSTLTTISSGSRSAPLPSRTIYVSQYREEVKDLDLRPKIKQTGSHLNVINNYFIDGDNLVLTEDASGDYDIEIWHKSMPARIMQPTGTLAVPDRWFNLLATVMMFYAQIKEENVRPETNHLINRYFRDAKHTETMLEGRATNMEAFL